MTVLETALWLSDDQSNGPTILDLLNIFPGRLMSLLDPR
jgi:hypothetical protein